MSKELAINQAIDAQMNKILKSMNETMGRPGAFPNGLENAQLQNLLGVTRETGSVEVVKNYIRYQVGRQKKTWGYTGPDKKTFGDQLIEELDKLEKIAQGIVNDDKIRGGQEDLDRVWMRLTQLYLGNLNRYFRYVKTPKGDRQ
jgi:hypothetical protein